ncbi:hypothetical protein [Ornithinibacillus contaminans]|uniref:hypothetical protein n=1 Tax=Ornithinibacillus contaminans TaxID=694055 RepID=UPI00069DA2E3|nr:hypothetical protein [Ornithinibacillus contaminans]
MSENKGSQTNFKSGSIPREELELPTLHFVVMDQWINVIGDKALLAWLKMYSWCKRDDKDSEVNQWEQARVPRSLMKVIKDLGVGKDTFYNKILKPLWNVGLIDIEEFGDSNIKGTKPINIIVYKYPQNNYSLSVKPLVQVRDYDKDYSSTSKTFAKKGGRPKKTNADSVQNIGGSEIEPPVVPDENGGGFSNRTGGRSEIEPNNSFNSINNSLNSFSNNLNPNLKEQEVDTYNVLWDLNIPKELKVKIKTMLINNEINLTLEKIFEIEEAYQYQIQKSNVIPDCDTIEETALNDFQFTQTVIAMFKKVKDIASVRALIDSWIKSGIAYKQNMINGETYFPIDSESYLIASEMKEVLGL